MMCSLINSSALAQHDGTTQCSPLACPRSPRNAQNTTCGCVNLPELAQHLTMLLLNTDTMQGSSIRILYEGIEHGGHAFAMLLDPILSRMLA
eukprot:1139724-Pelagomonas_calceolata.AAC.4